MRRDEVLAILAAHRDELRQSWHVRALSIYGSVARDEAGPESDVDVLVEFDRTIGLFHLIRLQHRLEEWLRSRVDLAEPAALKERLRDRILREAIRAA